MFGDRDKKLKIGHEKAGCLSLFYLLPKIHNQLLFFLGGGILFIRMTKALSKCITRN